MALCVFMSQAFDKSDGNLSRKLGGKGLITRVGGMEYGDAIVCVLELVDTH